MWIQRFRDLIVISLRYIQRQRLVDDRESATYNEFDLGSVINSCQSHCPRSRIVRMESQIATIEAVKDIVRDDLTECDDKQAAAFERYAVEPYLAPIFRYGEAETLVVVARRGDEVIYWEDVEEGFNLSPVDADGRILEHCCNPDTLGLALNAWIEGRTGPTKVGPAVPIE